MVHRADYSAKSSLLQVRERPAHKTAKSSQGRAVSTQLTPRFRLLLQIIWKQIEDAKRTEIVKELTAELPPHDQTKYSLSLAQQLSFEERSSLVERILRALSLIHI